MEGNKSWYEMGKEEFSLDAVAHEIVEKYRPEFIGKGSDQIVYRSPQHPDVVVKVSVDSIEYGLQWLQETGCDSRGLLSDPEVREKLATWLGVRSEQFGVMREYFDNEHTLAQRYITFTVPRVPEIVDAVARLRTGLDVFQDDLPNEVPVVALVQKVSPELLSGNFVSIDMSYSREDTSEFYVMARNALFQTGKPINAGLPDSYFDKEEKSVLMQDFVNRAVQYSTDTGRILDIAGQDNIILTKNDDGYSYTLVDALYPDFRTDTLEALKQAFTKCVESDDVSQVEINLYDVINGLQYVILINGLAERLGMAERIDYFADMASEESWEKILPFIQQQRRQWLHRHDEDLLHM